MTTYIIKRIIQAVFILLIVTLMVFLAMRLLPGDPIFMILSAGEMTNITEGQLQLLRHEHGLDEPLMMQYLNWLGGVFQGDFGVSITQHRSPVDFIAHGVPITMNLSLLAFVISLMIGIPAGITCAIRRGTWVDTLVTILANLGITIPIFWLGFMLMYVFALELRWLPVQGYISPFTDLAKNIKQIILPVFCLAIFPIASITRQTRSSMLEVMKQDYIRTAWSKGLKERSVVIKHALKNSVIPVVTLSGVALSHIIGGSVIIETVFNIQGIGQMMVSSVFAHDYPVVQGLILFIAAAVLLINLLVDISYGWLDPRIRYG